MARSSRTKSEPVRVVLAASAVGVSHWDEVRRGVMSYAQQAGWNFLTHHDDAGTTLVAEVARYLSENGSEQFGMERIIESFSVSRRTLERDFRTELGVTPAAYLHRLRAQNAIEFATKHPDAKHAAIATATGFTDDQHLRRTLRRLGLSLPTESAGGKSHVMGET